MSEKLFFKMYEDRKNTAHTSCVLTEEQMGLEIKGFNEFAHDDVLPPVFEPVWMTQEEYDALPEFKGF